MAEDGKANQRSNDNTSGYDLRMKEIKDTHSQYQYFYPALFIIVAFVIGLWLGIHWYFDEPGFWVNIHTEVLSIILTVFLLGIINKWQSDRTLRRSLITRMSSSDNATAINAAYELSRRDWTELENESFILANLQGAYLGNFNLKNCNLSGANLQSANLVGTDLRGTVLFLANLTNATLDFKDKRRSLSIDEFIRNYPLPDASLFEAMAKSDHQTPQEYLDSLNEMLDISAKFDEHTILPDAHRWNKTVDMKYFTDPYHKPKYWRPTEAQSKYLSTIHKLPLEDADRTLS